MLRLLLSLLVVFATVFPTFAQASDGKPLFNGRDLTGWKHVGPGYMTVEDGLIQTHGG